MLQETIETIKRPTIFDRFTPGGRGRIEAFKNKMLSCELADAEQKFIGSLTPFKEKLKVLPTNKERVMDIYDKDGISPISTASNTKIAVIAKRFDESRLQIIVDAADSIYMPGILVEGRYKSSPHNRVGNGWSIKRRIIRVKLATKQDGFVIDSIEDDSAKKDDFRLVQDLTWHHEDSDMEQLSIISDMARKTEALKIAASKIEEVLGNKTPDLNPNETR